MIEEVMIPFPATRAGRKRDAEQPVAAVRAAHDDHGDRDQTTAPVRQPAIQPAAPVNARGARRSFHGGLPEHLAGHVAPERAVPLSRLMAG